MVDAKDLLDYNENIRHRYFDSLAKLPWKEFTANREASFNSIRNIFVHTLTAVDFWLDFLQKENFCSKRKYDEYRTYEEIMFYMASVEKRMDQFINSLSTEKLDKIYKVTDEHGKIQRVTAEDILIHVFEEEVHHRGELIALLWQINVEPPQMGWKGPSNARLSARFLTFTSRIQSLDQFHLHSRVHFFARCPDNCNLHKEEGTKVF